MQKATRPREPINPPALIDYMMRQWRPAPRRLPARITGSARFAARRAALSRLFAGEALIIPTGHEKVRANDCVYRFRPASDFYYLTGNLEPDCVLVLMPRKRGHEAILFVEPNPGRSDSTFFTDRAKGELWVGPRLGVRESAHRFGVTRALGLPELPKFLQSLRSRKAPRHRTLRGIDPIVDGLVSAAGERDKELATALSEMRLIKEASEVAAMELAAVATRNAYDDVVRALKYAPTERVLEGVFDARARVDGNDVGYGTIVAAGAHACILHWTRNDGALRKGDLVLIDAGVEGDELYTADVTRTLPIGGKFSPAQREIYELVLAAQEAAIAAVRPGAEFLDPHRASIAVLTHGLERLGILPVSADEALAPDKQFHKRYTLHSTSHMLGLDVHDGANAREENARYGRLKPGMVLTVEPGLYFQLDDLTVPARYRGIGVRIEDDVLVTARGCRLLTDVPKKVAEVEAWVRRS
jgi:Xaa-Pro aminopeptidase